MDQKTLEGYRLSPQQEHLWQLQSPSVAQCLIRIDGPVETEVLRRSVLQVVRRHESFRSCFESLPGMGLPLQVIGEAEDALCWCEAQLPGDTDDALRLAMNEEAGKLLASSCSVALHALFIKGMRSYLCLTLSALCADRRTLHNLFREITSHYANEAATEETAVQYVQFSEWQHQLLEEPGLGEQAVTRVELTALTLPFERAENAGEPTYEFVTFNVDEATTAAIAARSAGEECTLEDFLLTCWHILLWRLTHEERVAILQQFEGRKFQELQDCCGLIDSYVPVALRCTKEMRFREALRKVSATTREVKTRGDYFTSPRMPTDPPAIGFVFEECERVVATAELSFSLQHLYSDCERFKVQLGASLASTSLELTFRYRSDLFDASTIRRIGRAYLSLITDAANNPGHAIGKLNIVAEEERQRLLLESETTAGGYLFASTIDEYFEKAVERTPDAVAVSFQQEQSTFIELNCRANQLAHYLRRKGVTPETRVALLVDRSVEMIVSVLAILKAGGAYLPIDPATPEDRLLYTLQDARASVLITDTAAPGFGGEVLYVDEMRKLAAFESDENPARHTLPDNLAYIIYTSGSTGKPKGVMIQHRSVINLFEALHRAIYRQHGFSRRVSLNAPLAFDASVKQLLQLLSGDTLCLIPEAVRPNGEELLALIKAEQIDVFDCTPSQLKMLLEAGLTKESRLVTLVGGEAIDESVWESLVQSSTHVFYNVYGPTECTVDATVCRITGERSRPSIGRPLANVQTVVLDWNGAPVLPGVSSELCIAGAGVARGYTGDPALTAERFIPNCFTVIPGARLYKTGDYVRHSPDGSIEFLGRQDDQVKLRGLRIELGEIEAALREHPSVAAACVVLREDQPGNQRLVGYTVAKRKDAPATDGYARYELRNGLAIAHQNRTDTTYLYQEIFEDEVYLKQGVSLPEHACIFDVGANIGLFTLFVAERCPDARIYAFEPLAPIFDVLRINSKLSGANIKLFPIGLSNVEKSETFTYYPQYPSRSGLTAYADATDEVAVIKKFLANKQESGVAEIGVMLAEADDLFGGYFNGELLECRVRRLSDVMREEKIDRIDLLKIDVQRAEFDVLQGIDDDDWTMIQQVVMEVHDASGTDTDGRVRNIVSLLEKHGFQTTVEQDALLRNTDRYNVYALRPTQTHSANGKSNGWKASHWTPNNGETSLTPGALREFLSRKVPEYMIPTTFVLLDSFPLNRNGKINRHQLPAPVSVADDTMKPARQLTPFEGLLAVIWMDVLGVKHVKPQDNFFEQGGHSLLATRLISRVRESFSIELPLRSVFESPTLEGLARRVETAKQKTESNVAARISPAGRDRRLPLSFAQERLWFLNQLEPNSFVYNCPCALSLTGPLDLQVFEQTLNEIVRRHESLRTTFAEQNGEPFQVIHPAQPIRLEVVDLSAAPQGAEKQRELITAEARAPFDLSNGPLFRVRMLRLSEQEHVVLFTTHHIVSDAWSLGVLVREVAALYQAFSKGETSPLSQLDIQYADFAIWQREYLEEQVLDEQLKYWKDQLQGAPGLLELPADRSRPAVQTYSGASRRFAFPRELTEPIRDVCRSEGVTMFMLLSAAFKVLLHRYTGQTDIVVGTDIAGRDREEIEGLVGFFINQLALRTQLRGDDTFREVLQREREICLQAFTHQAAPFGRVVEELNPVRSLSHSPLFQVSFNLNNTPNETAELTGLEMRRLDAGGGIAKFDLTLTMAEAGDRLGGAFEYNADLFDAASIDRIAAHFQTLLGGIVANIKTRVEELPLLAEMERAQLLTEWNETHKDFSTSSTLLHSLFESQARRSPDAIAATCGEQGITYAELDHRAGMLARRLRTHGVGPEQLTGVLLNGSIEMLVAMLGVLKAGGGFVPLDPQYPRERLLYMLGDAHVALVITRKELDLEAPGLPVLFIDDAAAEEAAVDVVELLPDNTAYVLYTSGSTGQPRGVVVNHGAIVNYALAMCDEFGLRSDDKMLQFASPSFDVLLEEVFPALACGASVVFVEDRQSLLSCTELSSTIDRYGITACELPAPYWHEFVAHLQRAGETAPPSLRLLLIGCERPSPQYITRWIEWGHSLIYVFGITETTITSTLQRFESASEPLQISIGRPVANTEAYVLDQRLGPVPVGVTGDLYLAGESLARGYLGHPMLTAAKFIPHPFTTAAGARLYKTGDMARRLPDGRLEFAGRVDRQLKLRGYRVETGEIEAAIKSHAGVRECFVAARTDDVTNEVRLTGYVVFDEATKFEAWSLQGYLREKLPDYMIPSSFVALTKLPLTANGKIDRDGLPVPEFEATSTPDLPTTATEELVADIFARVLRRKQVGRHEDFFALGGHSLLATQLISRLRDAFAVELTLRTVFQATTVASLSARIESERSGGRSLESRPLRKAERNKPLPLSFAQERLWFLNQLEPDSVAYNVPAALRLNGPLNFSVLQEAFTEIVRRHESLRTCFPNVDGRPYQSIQPPSPFVLEVIDLIDSADAEREAKALAAIEARRPFDLASGPLFRATVIKLDEGDHVLLCTMHHIISDGWSMGVLVREVAAVYDSYSRGETSPLSELELQYADYAVWQREHLSGALLEEQLSYWRGELAGAPAVLELPTDKPRPVIQTYRGATTRVMFRTELIERVREACREEGVTLFMFLLAAFKVLLYRYSGQKDIVVGSPLAGRNRVEIENLVGFFINTLVFRTQLSDEMTFLELLRQVRNLALNAYEHQDVPFEKLVEELQPLRQKSYSPLFQVMMALQNTPPSALSYQGLTIQPLEIEYDTSKFDLLLDMMEMPAGMLVTFKYNLDLFEAATMQRMAAQFERVLEFVATSTAARISQVPLLSAAERQTLLHDWNETATAYPVDSLHRLFADHAQRTPDATALVYGDRVLSYGELNTRGNQLANHLRSLGVSTETLVGLYVKQSPKMIIGMLGILKAGGAYVPLDPGYPLERLSLMIEDTGMPVLLTQDELAEQLPSYWGRVICLDSDWETIANESRQAPPDSSDANNLAYVIYTSGSTGRPKGVSVTHRAVVRLVVNTNYVSLNADDKIAQASNSSFDAATFEIWGALLNGAQLVSVSKDVALSPLDLSTEIQKQEISVMFLTTALFHQIADAAPGCFNSMRYVLTGGEVMDPNRMRTVLAAGSDKDLLHVYGPTETTTFATFELVQESPEQARTILIGTPIANATAYILDQQFEPVPFGVTGELYLGGDGLARGYLHHPMLTAQKFVPHPFAAEAGARLYRTGDKTTWQAGGKIDFQGRIDNQVKIRGYRVEPGEIEAMLTLHPSVRENVVVAISDGANGKRLVGYVATLSDTTSGELKSFLKERLPEYMVPSQFVFVDSLPITPNGKFDRSALPDPGYSSKTNEGESSVVLNPIEELLVNIWSDLLSVKRVSVEDDFFELGGHSLLATQLVSRVRECYGVELSLHTVFETPTITALAQAIEALLRDKVGLPNQPVVPVSRTEQLPLSFAQRRLWFLNQLEPDSVAYNVPAAMRLSGPLNVKVLEETFTEIVRRHESLRTSFPHVDGRPYQLIHPPAPFALQVVDLSACAEVERDEQAKVLAAVEARRLFDLSAGPLFRTTIIKLDEEEHVMLCTMHHIVSDGWSMGVLVREVAAVYDSFRRGEASPLAELELQYADYAVWQREYLSRALLEERLSYWRRQLEGAPSLLQLPTDKPRPAIQTYSGASMFVALNERLCEQIMALARQEEATTFMFLLAAFDVLLYRYSGQTDFIVGTPVAGRTHNEFAGMIGFFVNTLALRARINAEMSFRELLKQVRQVSLDSYVHQDMPFDKIVEELAPERMASHTPLFQVMFAFQNLSQTSVPIKDLIVTSFAAETQTSKFDLTVAMVNSGPTINGSFSYNTDLFEASTIAKMISHFQRLLLSIVSSPDSPLNTLEMLSEEEVVLLNTPVAIAELEQSFSF
jgi:amino acid adenylation domain-containing protein/FkbM family methyltransferase